MKRIFNRIREIEDIGRRLNGKQAIKNPKNNSAQNISNLQNKNKAKFTLPDVRGDIARIDKTENISNQNYLSPKNLKTYGLLQNKISSQSKSSQNSFNPIIENEAKITNIDPAWIKAIIKAESNFNPKALSKKGAMGLMQLMPNTAKELNVKNPYNPSQNIKGGTEYFRKMLNTFATTDEALAAYNAGPGVVKRFSGVPPYAETRNYINKVKSYYKDFK